MINLTEIFTQTVITIFDRTVETWHAASLLSDAAALSAAGRDVTLAFAVDALACNPDHPLEILSEKRLRWEIRFVADLPDGHACSARNEKRFG